jgi:thioredoxin 1
VTSTTPEEPPKSAAALIATLHSELRTIAAQARLLESLETEANPAPREALASALVELAQALAPQATQPRIVPKEDATAESPSSKEDNELTATVRQIPVGAFRNEVLEAETPVLVELHLEGYRPCEEARQALAGIAGLYDGQVEVRTLNVMEAEPEILPQIVKVGRDFFDRNLPKVLLYSHGAKIAEISGEVSTEDLVDLLRSEVG